MKKYEACGAITEIRQHVAEMLEDTTKWAEKEAAKSDLPKDQAEGLKAYHARQSAKLERWLKALDIAGNALTR